MKLVFCLPGNTFTKGFLESALVVFNRLALDKRFEVHMITDYSADIYNLKNTMIDKALFTGADFLMWIDSDMVFTVDDIYKLIDRDVDIISGVAMIEPERAALAWLENETISYYQPDRKDKGLTEVDFCGGAFMLVKADVYKKIPPLWYKAIDYVSGDKHRLTSEDFGFCETARNAGYKIHADLDVKVGHEKRWTLWPN